MKVRFEIDIRESEETLKEMFPAEKKWLRKERIHALYLLKKGYCKKYNGSGRKNSARKKYNKRTDKKI